MADKTGEHFIFLLGVDFWGVGGVEYKCVAGEGMPGHV